MEGIGDDVALDPGAIARDENGGVVIGEAQAGASDAQSGQRHVIGRDGDRVTVAVASDLRAFFTDEVQSLGNYECAGVYAGFDPNGVVRRSRVNPLLQRSREPRCHHAEKSDNHDSHAAFSFRDHQPASTMSRTEPQSRYAPACGKLYSRKLAICFTPMSSGVNGLMCMGAC